MKLNVKGLVFVGFAAAVFANAAAFAADNPATVEDPKTVTSTVFTERTYQKKLSAGDNITITGNTISATDTTYTAGTGITITGENNAIAVNGDITPYTPGANVQISGHEISATDTTYSAGTGIAISEQNVISVNGNLTDYAAGTNVQFTPGTGDNAGKTVISATDTTYNAFNGSANGLVPASGAEAGKVLSGNGSWITVDGTPYTAGSNIQINDHQISATDTTYTAGTGITITGANNAIAVDGDITPYTPGTNVQINGHEISATDTTYTAGSHVTITGANNAIGVTVDGAIAANDTGIVDGQTVYNYINNLTSSNVPQATGCSATNPCALVATGATTFAWQPIQQ